MKLRWFIYTVLVGLIPMLSRLCIYLFVKGVPPDFLLNPTDYLLFGLVLNVTNLNDLNQKKRILDSWFLAANGISILLIIAFAILLCLSMLAEIQKDLFNIVSMQKASMGFSIASFLWSFSIYFKLSRSIK